MLTYILELDDLPAGDTELGVDDDAIDANTDREREHCRRTLSLLLGPELDPIPFTGPDPHDHEGEDHTDDEDHDDEDHDHGPDDPHFWFDPTRVAATLPAIADGLAAAADTAISGRAVRVARTARGALEVAPAVLSSSCSLVTFPR